MGYKRRPLPATVQESRACHMEFQNLSFIGSWNQLAGFSPASVAVLQNHHEASRRNWALRLGRHLNLPCKHSPRLHRWFLMSTALWQVLSLSLSLSLSLFLSVCGVCGMCVYVCNVCICVYVCMYVYMCVLCECVYVCIMCLYVFICVYACECV